MRVDRFLWFARLARTRVLAREMAERGRLRIDGRVVDRAHAPVRIGQVLTFAHASRVRVLRIVALPARRGPAAEAAALYADLDVTDAVDGGGGGA